MSREGFPLEGKVQNVISIWNGLSMKRRIIVAGATAAVFVTILLLARLSGGSNLELLYAGLDERAAGEIISVLDQRNVPYEVRGDSIWVDAAKRDSLRMTLAGEGLPAGGGSGYELLDSLSGFGTTSQMFDAAYWRAREGELARTILSLPEVKKARVHLSRGPADPFRRDRNASASVTVTTRSGRLSDESAQALRHLVASAVAGMRPEDVQVIDSQAGLIGAESEGSRTLASTAQMRAQEIRQNVERMLAARYGAGRSVVEVSVDLVTEHELVTERRFDPSNRVAISSDSEEKTRQNSEKSGDVTVASNLPDGDAAKDTTGQSQSSETRERINYEVSETNRELRKEPGDIRRLSVAVLVDDAVDVAADGTATHSPRSEEELSALRELVASAVGFDEERGDTLTIKSMEFVPIAAEGTEAVGGAGSSFGNIDFMTLIQLAILAVVALVLGLFVVRPVLISARQTPSLPLPDGQRALPHRADAETEALNGVIDESEPANLPAIVSRTDNAQSEDPVERLRRLIGERQAETVEILRGWLDPSEEQA